MESISLARYLMYENDKSKILEAIYMLDKELKRIHSKNMYVPVMSAETIVYNSDDTFSFKNVYRIPFNKEECISYNILKFTQLSLGVYAHLATDGAAFADYTKLDKSFIYQNYPVIREFIPYGKEYYDTVLVDERYGYYSDYLDKKRLEESSVRGNSNRLVKATAAGRVYSDEKAAFSEVSFYPLICIMFVIFAIISYFVFVGFRG